jgi:hypothetical protein
MLTGKQRGWISRQRYLYHRGILSKDRIQKLEKISGWTWKRYNFLPFEEARKIVREQQFRSREEFWNWKKPHNIPRNPISVYKEWESWGDWLGSGYVATRFREYPLYEEARKYVHTLNLKTIKEWEDYCKSGVKPSNIPYSPVQVYADSGWKGMGDWLGTDFVAYQNRKHRPFEDARKFARSLKLTSREQWFDYVESHDLPKDISKTPSWVYKNEWLSWMDWLGTKPGFSEWKSFEDARTYARSLNLKTEEEWNAFCRSGKLPPDVTSNPWNLYRDKGWNGIGDWLGTGVIATQNRFFIPFEEARKYVHSLNLKSWSEWKFFVKNESFKNLNIPMDPRSSYEEFVSVSDWLGCKEKKDYLSYNEAKQILHTCGLRTKKEYVFHISNQNLALPVMASQYYRRRGEWLSWGDYLGYSTGKREFFGDYLPYDEAIKKVKTLNLSSNKQWKDLWESDPSYHDIPKCPDSVYEEWRGWEHFLGKETYVPFNEARTFVRGLTLTTRKEWYEYYCSGKMEGIRIPRNPERVYLSEWNGWQDFLGYNSFFTYDEAKIVIQKHGIKSLKELIDVKIPRMPIRPHSYYKNRGWISLEDFLNIKPIGYQEASKIVQSIGISSEPDYRKNYKKDSRLPSHPSEKFCSEWKGWDSFLGRQTYMSFQDARCFVRSLNLKSTSHWFGWWKENCPNIPRNPQQTYKDWTNWYDFLGK